MSRTSARPSTPHRLLPRLRAYAGATLLGAASLAGVARAVDYTWGINGGGAWTTATNWSPNSAFPNAATDTATFGNISVSSATITTGSPLTINRVTFNESSSTYALSISGGSLTFDGTTPQLRNINNGTVNISGSIVLAADTEINLANASSDMFISSSISGTGFGINKTGSGPLSLEGSHSYSGSTTISAGTLNLGYTTGQILTNNVVWHNAALNTASEIVNNSVLSISRQTGVQGTNFGLISGTGEVRISAGTITLSGSNTYTGATRVEPNTSFIGAGASLTFDSIVDVGGGASALGAPTTVSGGTIHLGSSADNSATLIYNGSGHTSDRVINLSGDAGTSSTLRHSGSGLLKLTGGVTATSANSKTLVLNADSGRTGEIAGIIADNSSTNTTSVTKQGSGTWILSGANTHTGGTTVSTGTLALGHVDALQYSTLSISNSTAREVTFTVAGTNTYNIGALSGSDPLAIGGNTISVGANNASTTYSGAITGTGGGLTKTGTGTFTLSSSGNAYTGATVVSQGILQVNVNNALGTNATGTTVNSGGALRLNGIAYTTAEALSLNGTGVGGGGALVNVGTSSYAGQITAATHATINAGGGTLTVTGGLVKDGTTLTIAGGGSVIVNSTGISGASASSDLVVDGTTLVVNANSNYNGPTTVQNSGVLVANAAVTTTQMTVDSNSTLSGTGSIDNGAGLVTLGGALIVGNAPTVADFEISGTGSTVLGGTSTLAFDLFTRGGDLTGDATSADRLRLFGTLNATLGGTLVLGNPAPLSGFAAGDEWLLVDLQGGASITGALGLNFTALNLGPGLTGSFDNGTGVFSIIAVPEPARVVLLLAGIQAVLLRRRRISSRHSRC